VAVEQVPNNEEAGVRTGVAEHAAMLAARRAAASKL
jgi:hypothetical protein